MMEIRCEIVDASGDDLLMVTFVDGAVLASVLFSSSDEKTVLSVLKEGFKSLKESS